jgi:probable HAF family extracellular repeat protein
MPPAVLRARFRNILVAATLGVAVAAQAAKPATEYTLQTLGALGSRGAFAAGINNRGEIVGSSSTTIPNPFYGTAVHGFVWDAGVMQDAGSPFGPSQLSHLMAINEKGVAAGESNGYVYKYQDGTWTPLGIVGEPAAINKFGMVAGTYYAGTGYRGFIANVGAFYELPTLGGRDSRVAGLNDQGVAVGSSMLANNETHAFIWENGVMRDLGTLGGTFSRATAINSRGVVVGQSTTASGSTAFIYDGVMRPLIASQPNAYPVAINDRGVVVGWLDNNASSFVLEDGVLTRLEDLPAARAGNWARLIPAAINDRGWITGWGWRNGGSVSEAFVLMPR